MSPLRVLLIAEESAGVRALKALLADGCEVAAVVADPETPGASVWRAAGEAALARWPVERLEDVPAMIAAQGGIDLLFNVHSLRLLPESLIRLPRVGGFNLHPGPLPEYAGLDVVSWAIYEGEREHAVTLHWLATRVDAGPIAYEARFALTPSDTAFTTYAKCAREGIPLLHQVIARVRAREDIPAMEQDPTRRRYYRRGAPREGWIDWHESAERIAAFSRACDYGLFPSPWGRPRTLLAGEELQVLTCSAHVDEGDATAAQEAAPGTVLASDGGGVIVRAGAGVVRLGMVMLRGTRMPAHAALGTGTRLESGLAPSLPAIPGES